MPDGTTAFREKLTREELVRAFDLARVVRSPAQFDVAKLAAMNHDYMADLAAAHPGALVRRLREDAAREGLDAGRYGEAEYLALVREAAPRASTLAGLIEKTRFFFAPRVDVDPAEKGVRKAFAREGAGAALREVTARLAAVPAGEWRRERLEVVMKRAADELAQGDMGRVAQPVRIMVAGTPASPAIDVTLEILGRERSLDRLADAANLARLGL
jgi:glutamyl-tRNA synthetase